MAKRIGGARRKTRHKFGKNYRRRGKISLTAFFQSFEIGEKVITIGNPQGLKLSVTEGIISQVDRQFQNQIGRYIQTDAAINPGNSGGPLINTDGKVIGINNFKLQGDNIGFSLESNFITKAINSFSNINQGKNLI